MPSKLTSKDKTLPEVVFQAFEHYSHEVQEPLLAIRELILDVKNSDEEIGQLEEALRWGELSFITAKPSTGSIIRLAKTKSDQPAMFFHCGTTLIETFRAQYSHLFNFEANRALVLRMPVSETHTELRHCISQALRYRLDKKLKFNQDPRP